MFALNNPALRAFATQVVRELQVAQVLIRACRTGFELRHVTDREAAIQSLREINAGELRALAQFAADGAFRPLKAAPNLRAGWRLPVKDDAELGRALDELYPGAVADWFAAQSPEPPVTHFRAFTARQSGMYRVTALLTDAQASAVARACCHSGFCLKRRLWTVDGLAPDNGAEKSLIPCLEPCALLLEFARKATRMEQQGKVKLELSSDEIASLNAALRFALDHPDPAAREADFDAPDNPRRLRLMFDKLSAVARPNLPVERE